MGKKIEKIIMDDFNETYKFEIDKEKILNNIQMDKDEDLECEVKTSITISKLKSLCKKLTISLSVVVVCLVITIFIGFIGDKRNDYNNDILTKDFKAYMGEYSGIRNWNNFSYIKNDMLELYIYECKDTKNNINYYFYKAKCGEDVDGCSIIISNTKIILSNDSYGLLCEIQKDQEIIFSIENNNIITDYKIK